MRAFSFDDLFTELPDQKVKVKQPVVFFGYVLRTNSILDNFDFPNTSTFEAWNEIGTPEIVSAAIPNYKETLPKKTLRHKFKYSLLLLKLKLFPIIEFFRGIF